MKGQTRKFAAVILSLAMALTLMPLTDVNAAPKTKLNKKFATIYVGGTIKLKVTNSKVKVKWITSNKKVAVVKKGKVTGKKAGKAVITAKVRKKAYKCKITVKSKTSNNMPSEAEVTTKKQDSNVKPKETTTVKQAEQITTKHVEETTKIQTEQPTTKPAEETTKIQTE